MDHAALVAALKAPDFYPHRVEKVDFIQTHISSVFLTGERAYKLKKPVNFGFLDFSTIELRRRYCEAEVALNRRLAPDVYLGVEPIVRDGDRLRLGGASDSGGSGDRGEVVDWLVVMRQLDQARLGVRVIERGELTARHVDQLVEQLVPFYRRAPTGEGVDHWGTLEAMKVNTDENFAQTEAYVGKLISPARFAHVREFTERFYRERADLFTRRVAEGRVREIHGDLHLVNVFFSDPPVIFDCIEFNDRLRCGDVAVDLAFLAMDLDYRGRRDLAQRLIDGYVAASGDAGLREPLDFYKCYRAYVRGKISSFTSSDPALDDRERRAQRNLARHYFGLAYRYAGGAMRPALVVVFGLMGSGKTSIVRFLRETFGWHVLSTDAVRKQIAGVGENTRVWVPYGSGLYSSEMNDRTYGEVCRRAENLLYAGFPAAIDGAYKKRSERAPLIELARRADGRLLFLETVCEPETQRRRLEKRQRYDTRSDGRIELMETQRADFEASDDAHRELHVELSTDGPVEETRRRLVEVLAAAGLLEAGEHELEGSA